MLALRKADFLSVEEYLYYERDSPIRHEYVNGELFAMAGASDDHYRISRNICRPLEDLLEDTSCESFMADMKVQANASIYYYPDVVVACDNPASTDPYYRKEPVLIVEVTSPKTEKKDRKEKLEAYQNIKSLKEYVIVAQDEVSVHLYRRIRNGIWQNLTLTDINDTLELKSVGLTLPLTQIYRRVTFPPPPKLKRKPHPNA